MFVGPRAAHSGRSNSTSSAPAASAAIATPSPADTAAPLTVCAAVDDLRRGETARLQRVVMLWPASRRVA